MRCLKNISAILLFLAFLLPPLLTWSRLTLEKRLVRKEIKRMLMHSADPEALSSIRVKQEEATLALRWEHAKEFEYQGEMYDVVSSDTAGEEIVFLCWWDHEETALNRELRSLTDRIFSSRPGKRTQADKLISFFKSMAGPDRFCFPVPMLTEKVQHSLCISYPEGLTERPPVPPPKDRA